MSTLTDLADACRTSGLTVVELPGWRTNVSNGGTNFSGVLCHHTGGPRNDRAYAEWMAFTGRSDLPPPICNLALDRAGTVYVCSAGNANHGGQARASGPMPAAPDANVIYVGIEAMNTGSEGWTPVQYDAYVALCAALCAHYGWPATHVRAHRETSVTGKPDPAGRTPGGATFDMDRFRSDIAERMTEKEAPIMRGLPVVVFNAVGAMPTDRRPLGNRVLASAATRGALLIGVECDDLEPAAVLDRDVWWWRHREGELHDGTFLAGLRKRTSASEVEVIFGAPSSPVNAERYFLKAKVRVDNTWSMTVAAMHVPRWKEGGREAATEMVLRSQTLGADLLGADANIHHDAMVARYPSRVVRSAEVMHLAARKDRLALGNAQPFDLLDGTEMDDHPGLRVMVAPR